MNDPKIFKKVNSISTFHKQILKISCKEWFKNHSGTAAISLERVLKISNTEIMSLMEELTNTGLGNINKNVSLCQLSLQKRKGGRSLDCQNIITHIFFPSSQVLTKQYFNSKLSRIDIPEYTKKLHLGAQQLELAFFHESVIKKYFDRPDKYFIDDTLSGGTLKLYTNLGNEDFIHLIYGKKLLNNGKIAICAIYKDLSEMSPNEQKYWNSFEIKEDNLSYGIEDENFQLFLKRTYLGEPVDYLDPISNLAVVLGAINNVFGSTPLFCKLENAHLRVPVINTIKAFCDSCSELYKLIGPDNINQTVLKNFLRERAGLKNEDFIHISTQRNLSTLQLVELLEKNICNCDSLSKHIANIKKMRIKADHVILDIQVENENYSQHFNELCNNIVLSFEYFLKHLKTVVNSDNGSQIK